MVAISSMKKGERAKIIDFGQTPKSMRMRLYGLGFCPGAELVIEHIAPLGCPIAVKVGGTLISLRLVEFQYVRLKKYE